jgi:tetratricopeptide (TPR) repeat protein
MDRTDSDVIAAETTLHNHPIGSPDRAWALYELAKVLQNRFSTKNSGKYLDWAKELYLEAIALESDFSKQARYFNNLGIVHQYRYNQTGDPLDLDAFVNYTRQATHHTSCELRPAILKNYANALQDRYYHRGDVRDLNECITIYQDTLKLPAAGSVRPKLCSNLCAALTALFQVGDEPSDLDEACRLGHEAVSSTDDQHPMRAIFLDTFANALYARYVSTNSIPDLDEAISKGEAAISLAEEQGLQELPNFCVNLGGSLASRFKISRNTTDLDEAIDMFDIAKDSISSSHPSYEKFLVNKGIALRMRFEETASEEDLTQSVIACSEAVGSEVTENQLRAQSEDALGNALLRKYELAGSPDILDEAVLIYKQALERAPNSSHASEIWQNLGSALQTRFELRGSMEDLDDALRAIESGLASTEKELPGYASSLIGLGNVLVRKFERLNIPDALDRAISAYKEALDLTSESDRTRAGRLTCLGHALQIRFELTGSSTDFENAVRYCQRSVDISHREPNYYICLVNLGNCFLRRVLRESSTENLRHLDKAIKILQTAADEVPKDFSTRAMCLNDLGKAYELRFEQTHRFDDFNEAARNYKVALNLDSAPPMLRVMAGYRGALLTWQKDLLKAAVFVKEATKLLPIISPRILNRSDQQDNIATFSGLASYGASILLESGSEALEALQTLELSRGVMNTLILETRIDTTDLEKYDPDLAEEFKILRDQLDSPSISFPKASDVPIGVKLDMERRIAASKRLNELINKIRSDNKIGSVLLGPSKEDLQSLSDSGAIVTINVSEIRSDALIVIRNRLWHLQLPNLNQADVLQQAQKFLETLEKDTPVIRKKTNKSLHNIFQWLWDAAVGPILSELGIVGKTQKWPRIWWIPVGLMSIFPIHAAGDHSGKTDENALDRVLSSYATTIRSLSYSRAIKKPTSTTFTKAVFITMSATPNQNDLPFAEAEVSHLVSQIPDENITKVVFKSPAYKHEVLPALQDCHIAHFSCHGVVDLSDPSASSLLLSDWETNPLMVSDINTLKLENAQLAYLSACHASSNRVLDLLDEGIHLTGAFQMAGFPQTIGTLWQVEDERSVQISKMVWENMLSDGGVVNVEKAPVGLHHAVRRLREQTRWVEGVDMRFQDQPVVWAPFIHMGI